MFVNGFQAENDLKIAQEEYDRQAEITKLLMEGVPSAQPQHLQHLLDFVDTQAAFYLKCHESLMSLQSDLSGLAYRTKNKFVVIVFYMESLQ